MKKVLAVHSYHQTFPWQDNMDRALEKAFASQQKFQVEVFHEYMDSLRLSDPARQISFFDHLKKRYKGVEFDLVMASDNAALYFLLNYRNWLFGPKQTVFYGIDGFHPQMLHGTQNYAGVLEAVDAVGTLQIALKMWPQTKRVILFGRHSQAFYDRQSRLEETVRKINGPEIISRAGLRIPQVIEKVQTLKHDDLVLVIDPILDQHGRLMWRTRPNRMITPHCPVPIFSLWDVIVHNGVTGGKVVTAEDQGRLGAELALEILGGENPEAKSKIIRSHNRYMFNYDQLVRFNIPLSKLPDDSIVVNEPRSIWQDYRETIVTLSLLLVFLGLLVLLLGFNVVRRKRAERSLKKSEELFRTVFEQAAVGICYCSLNGRLLKANDKFCRITGYTEKEIENISFKQITHPDDIESDITNVRGLIAGQGAQYSQEKRYVNKNGEIVWVNLTVSLVRDENGKPDYLIAVAEDISDRKLAEQQKEKLENQLRQAQKMEAVGTLAGGIAHDFNNILAAVRGYTELAMHRTHNGKNVDHELGQVIEAVEKARELIKGILTISRKTDALHRPLDLNHEVKQAAGMLERTIPKMVKVELMLSDRKLTALGDASQMQQLMLNLGTNAKDAMPNGGTISIETGREELTEDFCRSTPEAVPGKYVRLSVSDTGHGMPPEIVENIFDPFFTTKETGRGTGLGLAMAYGIVKSHHGFIVCDSKPGRGTTFKVYLPLANESELPAGEEEPERPVQEGRNETILVVDDEQALRQVSRQLLGASGYNTILADSGEKAIEVYQKLGGDAIDLVILDISMPGMGGRRCLKRLLELDPEARIIMASGYSKDGSAKQFMEDGALGYVAKPFSFRELLATIRTCLDDPKGVGMN